MQKVIGRMYKLLAQTDKQAAVEAALITLVREAVVTGQRAGSKDEVRRLMRAGDRTWRTFSYRTHGVAKPSGFKDYMRHYYPELTGEPATT